LSGKEDRLRVKILRRRQKGGKRGPRQKEKKKQTLKKSQGREPPAEHRQPPGPIFPRDDTGKREKKKNKKTLKRMKPGQRCTVQPPKQKRAKTNTDP